MRPGRGIDQRQHLDQGLFQIRAERPRGALREGRLPVDREWPLKNLMLA
jgi:hypothetical protein